MLSVKKRMTIMGTLYLVVVASMVYTIFIEFTWHLPCIALGGIFTALILNNRYQVED